MDKTTRRNFLKQLATLPAVGLLLNRTSEKTVEEPEPIPYIPPMQNKYTTSSSACIGSFSTGSDQEVPEGYPYFGGKAHYVGPETDEDLEY